MAGVTMRGLRKTYKDGSGARVTALSDLSLDVGSGEFLVLLGESGCGKSTILNAVAGLIELDEGQIVIDEKVVSGPSGRGRTSLNPEKRNIGMVFQSYALWPHMTAFDNVAFPLRIRGMSQEEVRRAVERTLELVQCAQLRDRYPGELSGGQQQRIALARAVVAKPAVILLDEPLSNLDAGLRSDLRDMLAGLHEELRFTGIYVTHDQAEALALGDTVAVMRGGVIEQLGQPGDIYNRPATVYVAEFIGANVVPVRGLTADGHLDTGLGPVPRPAGGNGAVPRSLAFHPHQARLTAVAGRADAATISSRRYGGARWEYTVVAADGMRVRILRPQEEPPLDPATPVVLDVSPEAVVVFDG